MLRRKQLGTAMLLLGTLAGCQRSPVRTPAATAPLAGNDPIPAHDGITAEAAHAGGPPAPANLVAAARGGVVHLTWMPGSSAAREFRIYRFTGPDPAGIKSIGTARSTAFDDATAARGTTYAYFVTAVDEFGVAGGPSNMVTISVQ